MQGSLMASPSSCFPYNNKEDHEEEDRQERDWLELGLGTTCLNSTRSHHPGLGLGFDDEGFEKESSRSRRGASNVHHYGLWSPSLHHLHHDHHGSASPSWAWRLQVHDHHHHHHHRHHQQNLLLPAPVGLHHNDYYSRPRPEIGFWFSLLPLCNREAEVLPQIPKAYIRVKDEDVTVFMVKKYLVGKLGLVSEAEIDILCMGQNLLHSQTLKDVRDAVWLPRLFHDVISTLNENVHGTTTSLLMPLQYRRHCR